MTIEEKRLKIKEHCSRTKMCTGCKLNFELNCWDVIKYGSDEAVEKLYNILTYDTEAVTRNLSAVSDRFNCEKCGIRLEDCVKAVYDEEDEDTKYQEYEFKFCPECGRKVVEE